MTDHLLGLYGTGFFGTLLYDRSARIDQMITCTP
jgi:hypothetical protein